jgi:chromosomal replication initiator protein
MSVARARSVTVEEVIEEAASQFGFHPVLLTGPSRERHLVTARHIAMYATRVLTDLSFPQIAKAFGGRDHTTVIHAVDKISALLAGDDERTYRDVGALLGAFEREEP